jgi:mercuric reductase
MEQVSRADDDDLAIIGSGGAAFAAAIAARRKDRRVVMVERGRVGGTCVNTGCVPSKAMLAAAEARHVALEQHFPGIRTDAQAVDLPDLAAGTRHLVDSLRADKYVHLATEYGWEILAGEARFVDGPCLDVTLSGGGTARVEAEHYVVATGAAPWIPPIPGLADSGFLTSTTALQLDDLPRSMVVVGGNYVGLELAQLFARLGARVTVVEMLDRLAPAEEPEISAAIERIFADDHITVHTGRSVTATSPLPGGRVAVSIDGPDPQTLEADRLLIATGRRPATNGLDLAAVGVKVGGHGEIVVDDYLRTSTPKIWAVGDVTGHPQFVYVAAAHGALAVDNAFDEAGRTVDYHAMPRVTFTSPQIASVGLTETQATDAGRRCDSRVLPMEYVPRALVNRDTRGLVKLVADHHTGQLLGAHAVTECAGELISTAVYALANRMTVHQIADLWCPYLTMTESIKLAAQTFTRDITKLSCCAT